MKKLLFTLLAVGYAWVLPAQEGLFGMERKGETIHWSIPDTLLGRDLMLTTTVLKAPARTTPDYTKKYGHPGDLFGPIILRFRKVDGEMWVTDPLYDRHLPATSDDPIVNIARLRGDERLYDTLPIVSESDGQTTIDVSRWLKSNQLLGLKPVAFELELGTEDASRTQLKDVKALPHCMLIRKRLTYRPLPFMTPGRKASTSESEWEVGICLSLLPKHPMPVRPSGMPYFGITQQEYQTNPLRASSRSLMKRWRLELTPEDSVRYFQGELVEPIHPIVVYVDRHTPARWLPCIMASIDAWQEAFEQAGFKNAIRAVKEPTDDPNFYLETVRAIQCLRPYSLPGQHGRSESLSHRHLQFRSRPVAALVFHPMRRGRPAGLGRGAAPIRHGRTDEAGLHARNRPFTGTGTQLLRQQPPFAG